MTTITEKNPLLWVRQCLGRVYRRLFSPAPVHHVEAYSQEGEDLILRRLFLGQKVGFYADVGAHHPKRLSNTYLFYLAGWSGINIDAMPGSMAVFRQERPRDRNIEAAIGIDSGTTRTFWIFNEPALNTFDEALARSREGGPYQFTIIGKHEVRTRALSEIFDENVPKGTKIDFLTVDVEGLDLEVLKTNDWQRYRPSYVLAECYGVPLAELHHDLVCLFLFNNRYEVVAKTVNTVIFKDIDFHPE